MKHILLATLFSLGISKKSRAASKKYLPTGNAYYDASTNVDLKTHEGNRVFVKNQAVVPGTVSNLISEIPWLRRAFRRSYSTQKRKNQRAPLLWPDSWTYGRTPTQPPIQPRSYVCAHHHPQRCRFGSFAFGHRKKRKNPTEKVPALEWPQTAQDLLQPWIRTSITAHCRSHQG